MSRIEVTRDENKHTGPACYRAGKRGRVTVLCPYGHLVATVERWAGSTWEARAAWGDDIVTCHGALAADAKPYPFRDTFMGQGPPDCKACAERTRRGFDGLCPFHANERTRAELAAERASALRGDYGAAVQCVAEATRCTAINMEHERCALAAGHEGEHRAAS